MRAFQLLVAIAICTLASGTVAVSPKELVEQFVKMDVEGIRLTSDGWKRADALFVKPSQPPHPKTIVVIARSYAVSQDTPPSNANEWDFGYEEVGRINTYSLRFTVTTNGYMKEFQGYTVTSVRAAAANDGVKRKDSTATELRIDGEQPTTMRLTPQAAIRYLKQMRNKSASPSVQKNATEAIAKVSQYR